MYPALEALGLFHPVWLSGSIVEGQDGLGTAGDAAQRHGDHQHEALDNGGAGDQHIALTGTSVGLEHRVHGNDHHIVHGDDDKGRKAHQQDPLDQLPVIAAEADLHRNLFSEEEGQDKGTAGHLGEDCGHSCSGHAHV